MTVFGKIKEELKKTLSMLTEQETFSSEIKVSEMVIGGKVELINSDGSLSPAEDGEYTIDSDVIVVKDGMIESINGETASKEEDAPAEEMKDEAPVEETPAEAEPDANAELKAEIEAMKAETADLKNQIAEIKALIEGKAAQDEEMSAQFNTQLTELNTTIKTLITTPAEFSRTNQSPAVKDSKDEKIKRLSEIFGNSKK